MLFFSEYLGIHFNGLMVWGFLMAFFFSLLMYFTEARKDLSVMSTSLIMFMSYFISGDWDLYISDKTQIYLFWLYFDFFTIFLIYITHRLFKFEVNSAIYLIYIGLILNAILFLSMHIDINVRMNREEWWLWSLYSIGMNAIDFSMIVSLIVAKDFLKISCIPKLFTKKALT